MNEQIEEIYRILLKGCNGIECSECVGKDKMRDGCLKYHNADAIYNAGYRKSTDVAKEIFEEIERLLSANMSGEFRGDSVEWFDYFDLRLAEDIAELKKKYESEGEQ